MDAKLLIENWDDKKIKKKREECKKWWNEHKNKIQESIKMRVNS